MLRGPLKAWFFLSTFSLALIIAGFSLGDRQGLILGVGLALGINTLVFFYGDWRTLRVFNNMKVEGQDPWGLMPLVRKKSHLLKLPPPEVYILEHSTPQAFSIGRNWKSAKICLTRGLLDLLEPAEIEIVVALELIRIERLDTFSFQVASAFGDGVLLISLFLDRITRLVLGSNNSPQHQGFFQNMMAPLASLAVRLTVGPQNYLQADKKTAEWIRDAKGLAAVLWKLESYAGTQPLLVPPSMAHLFIVNPLTGYGRDQYFPVQPTIQRRIEHLLGYYPL